jgi:hypothetical protein
MLLSPVIFFYGFFILLVFVIGVAPTAFWQRVGGSLSARAARSRRDRMADRLARVVRGADFTPDIDYIPAGIGFAVDTARTLLFVAGELAGRPAEALLPLSTFRACATGVNTGGLTEDNYLDLMPADAAAPAWRISCGTQGATADAIAGQLGALGLQRF